MEIINLTAEDVFIDPATRTRTGGPTKDSVQKLAESIRSVGGLIQPITVAAPFSPAAVESGRPYQLVAGETRLLACVLAGLEAIPAVVRATESVDTAAADAGIVGLTENIVRTDVPWYDRMMAIRHHMDTFKVGSKAMAAQLGIEQTSLNSMLRPWKAWPEAVDNPVVVAALNSGTLSYPTINNVAKLDKADRDKLLAKFVDGKITGAEMNDRATELRAESASSPDPADNGTPESGGGVEGVAAGGRKPTKAKKGKSKQVRIPQMLKDLDILISRASPVEEGGPETWDAVSTVAWCMCMYVTGKYSVKALVDNLEGNLSYTPAAE